MSAKRWLGVIFLVLAVVGLMDAVYLTAKDLLHSQVTCSVLSGCNEVLGSKYAHIGPIPVALVGAGYYALLVGLAGWFLQHMRQSTVRHMKYITTLGLLASVGFVYLQIFVIHSVCIYCFGSAITTLLLFSISYLGYND
ncbi:MAG: vitamin K epoxide reductase family protein [Candidatus Doudnabacteria bacterium]|nr:vitamin K epoxide reductase family protein [Candidatus Doudnabacteria bacterium]